MNNTTTADTIKDWVNLHSEHLLSWAFHKTSDEELAKDLVQDTFMAAVKSFENFKGKSSPKTWLFSILNNKIYDHFRKQFRSPIIKKGFDEQFFTTGFFDSDNHWIKGKMPGNWGDEEKHLLDDQQFRETLGNCLKDLPPKWLSAVQLKYLDEKSFGEICKALNVTQTNYWQILHRAKLQLRQCLETRWFKQ